jgi:hypothetical protein
MTLIGRLRRGGSVLALLAAVVLVAPSVADCALFGGVTDDHPVVASGPVPVASVAVNGVSHSMPGDCDGPCAPHVAHCLLKSVLVGRAGEAAVLYPCGLLLAVALVATATVRLSVGGVRGPPVAAVGAVGGRVILTRICIARR